MPGLKALKDIPSLSTLYRAGHLMPTREPNLPEPSQDHNDRLSTIEYDITKLEVDAIVNAANSRLSVGAGVCGAIHRIAGPGLARECRTLNGCETGSAKITDAYDLPCKKVIHAVGPIYDNKEISEPLLMSCYRTSLQLAIDNDCKSIAFPAISTAIFGYPRRPAADAVLRELTAFLNGPHAKKLDKIIFCNFLDSKNVEIYAELLPAFFPPTQADTSDAGTYRRSEKTIGDPTK